MGIRILLLLFSHQAVSDPCNPIDCSLPGSSLHGISQTRILERLSFHPPGDLPDPGIELACPALAGGFFTAEPPGKPLKSLTSSFYRLGNWASETCLAQGHTVSYQSRGSNPDSQILNQILWGVGGGYNTARGLSPPVWGPIVLFFWPMPSSASALWSGQLPNTSKSHPSIYSSIQYFLSLPHFGVRLSAVSETTKFTA